MARLPSLLTLAKTATRRFAKLRDACEARVVRREFASWHIFSFEPYYFERNQYSRGRRLPKKPGAKHDCIEYGWDADGLPARRRDWSGFLRKWHEDEPAVAVGERTIDSYRLALVIATRSGGTCCRPASRSAWPPSSTGGRPPTWRASTATRSSCATRR